jgi:hypothetical protein
MPLLGFDRPLTKAELLDEARALADGVAAVLSSGLTPVSEPGIGVIHNWRTGHTDPAHPIHQMASRVGGFPPALARYFVAKYSQRGDRVLDPFCGKGTALFEAGRLGRIPLGGDVAPDAVMLSRAKTRPVQVVDVAGYIESLNVSRATKCIVPPDVRLFYSSSTLKQMVSIRSQLLSDAERSSAIGDVARFVLGVFLGLAHGHSRLALSLPCNQCFAMAPRYVRRYVKINGLRRPSRDVRQCLLDRSMTCLPFPSAFSAGVVSERAAHTVRSYACRPEGRVRLILTSPPYLNRQTYLKDSWLRLWWLGRDGKESRKQSLETGSVSAFVDGMTSTLDALADVTSADGRLVLVCGHAKTWIGETKRVVRISDLCLLANSRLDRRRWKPELLVHDRKLMKRGSYFAVHRGREADGNGQHRPRYGEEEILILARQRG